HPHRRRPRAGPELQVGLLRLRRQNVGDQQFLVAIEREVRELQIRRRTVGLAVGYGVAVAAGVAEGVAIHTVVARADWNAAPSEVGALSRAEQQRDRFRLRRVGGEGCPALLVEGGSETLPGL